MSCGAGTMAHASTLAQDAAKVRLTLRGSITAPHDHDRRRVAALYTHRIDSR
jgi:hypothetical protein